MVDQMEAAEKSRAGVVNRRILLRGGIWLAFAGGMAAYTMTARAVPSTPAATPVGSPVSPVSSPVAGVTVKMTAQLRFDPPQVTIKAREAVTWVNDSPLPHTATGDPNQNPVNKTYPEYIQLPQNAAPWGSDLMGQGERYTHVFTVEGEYKYICIPHVLSGMRGTIRVEP